MKVAIKRIDKTLPLPVYQTPGAVAFDLYAREAAAIPPQSVARIPTNVIIEVPAGYMLYVKDRSSTASRKKLLATAGFVDQDYCGEGDEILLQVYNFSQEPVTVERGERLGQGALIKIERAEWIDVDQLSAKNRGGFGTTGHSH
ncbi:MAG: Deoxyuridine 5'-triphosphate nucleotidohydrolase Dut [Candidatus Magasanikbacteria bacterium GW2011_GWA2_50_22]|uniref:dUTP diphosphatase n=1 Tax=Candidatus Magasanikbacteria bacterium GW2011_GWA2_50_22 TaxID=1619043 RepID=A0A0G1YRF9_9BACT|nr:MAG: Deoxyuridine 5'-triphosphate nucleotidohydrolase Dut [Candidatus Magasanikbacteria bacterium GW2011_GWA2_50_22]